MKAPPPTRQTQTTVWGPHGWEMGNPITRMHASTASPTPGPRSGETPHGDASPLVSEGPPHRRIHRQGGGEGHQHSYQCDDVCGDTDGFVLPERPATTSRATPNAVIGGRPATCHT
jgi:hypothetical protein